MLPLLTTGDVILVETLFLKVHGQSLALPARQTFLFAGNWCCMTTERLSLAILKRQTFSMTFIMFSVDVSFNVERRDDCHHDYFQTFWHWVLHFSFFFCVLHQKYVITIFFC